MAGGDERWMIYDTSPETMSVNICNCALNDKITRGRGRYVDPGREHTHTHIYTNVGSVSPTH